jgi:hypothetical protein
MGEPEAGVALKGRLHPRRYRVAATVIAAVAAIGLLVASSITARSAAGPAGQNFTAPLSGGEEVPPVETKARGLAIFQLSKDGGELHYKLIVASVENVTQAHIHLAPRGANGPVVAWLYPSAPPARPIPGEFNGVLAEGVITAEFLVGPLAGTSMDDLVAAMRAGNTYVNVHTSQHPAGEIRGQIDPRGPRRSRITRGLSLSAPKTGEHASPRLGLRNLARALAEEASNQTSPRLGLRNLARALAEEARNLTSPGLGPRNRTSPE